MVSTGATAPTIKGLQSFTWEAWIKVDEANSRHAKQRLWLESKPGKRGTPRFGVTAIRGRLQFELAVQDTDSVTNYTYPMEWGDYWHHIAFAANTSNQEYFIYLNGGLVQTGPLVGGGRDNEDNIIKISDTTPWGTELAYNASGTKWKGKVDCIRLWNNVRSQNQITTSMNEFLVATDHQNLLAQFNLESSYPVVAEKHGYFDHSWDLRLWRSGGYVSSGTHTIDRPFLSDGEIDVDAPTTPTMSAPTNVTETQFTLSWSESTDNVYVQFYEVDVATDNTFTNLVDGWAGKNVGRQRTITVDGLIPNTAYFARVRALDANRNASGYASYNSNAPIITPTSSDLTAPKNPPLGVHAASITPNSFVIAWDTAPTSDGVTGYKLDVSTSPTFATFLPQYRNRDVGLVHSFTVDLDIEPLSSYWVKLRAYDAAGNESWDSTPLHVITDAAPDLEPPSIVETLPPNSIESNRFTAQWSPGVDNVGVVGYRLDVGFDEDFGEFLLGYHDLDVGNVTRFNVQGLQPDTSYYYRVRAYDAAGNISANAEVPQMVVTDPATFEESGILEHQSISMSEHYVTGGTAGPEEEGEEVLVSVGSRVRFMFEPSPTDGQTEATSVFFALTDVVIPGDIEVRHADTDQVLGTATIFEGSTQVTVNIPILEEDEVFGLDVISPDGEFKIATRHNESRMGAFVEYEINMWTMMRPVDTRQWSEPIAATNLLKNPTFTNGLVGIDPSGASTVVQIMDSPYHSGVKAARVTFATASDTRGVTFNSPTALNIDGPKMLHASFLIAPTDPEFPAHDLTVTAQVRRSNSSYVDVDVSTIQIESGMSLVRVSGLVGASTHKIDEVLLTLHTNNPSAAGDFMVMSPTVILTDPDNEDEVVPFHGNTRYAVWDDTPFNGPSTMYVNRILGEAHYVGDSNEDGDGFLVLVDEEAGLNPDTWYGEGSSAIDRETKTLTASTRSMFFVNAVADGAFDLPGGPLWEPWKSSEGGQFLRSQDVSDYGLRPRTGFQYLEALHSTEHATDGLVEFGFRYKVPFSAATFQRGPIRMSLAGKSGQDIVIGIQRASGVETLLTHTPTADYVWEDLVIDTSSVTTGGFLTVFSDNASYSQTEPIAIDRVQVGSDLPFYADERFVGAYQLGAPNLGEVMAIIAPDTTYNLAWVFDDPDGVSAGFRLGGQGIVGDQITVAPTPDTVLTVLGLEAEVTDTTMTIIVPYEGDVNATAEAQIEWRRSDRSVEHGWHRVTASWDRNSKRITGVVESLSPRTSYDVRVEVRDGEDGWVFGENPITRTFLTDSSPVQNLTPIRILFGGYVLLDPRANDRWVSEHNAFDHPSRETQIEKLPRNDGAVELSDWWAERRITMSGGIRAKSREELAVKLRDLRRALAPRQQKLVIDTLDTRSYYFTATCTDFKAPEIAGETYLHLNWTAEFTCADPFRYSNEEIVESNIQLTNNETVTLVNEGDLPVNPVIEIVNPSVTAVEVTLMNRTTGERITPVDKLKRDERLEVNSDRLRLMKNGVENDFSGSFPSLSVGQNVLTVQITPPVTAVNVTVRRRHRYF